MTPTQCDRLLAALRTGLTLSGAASAADVDVRAVRAQSEADPVFAADFEDAQQEALDHFEDVIAQAAHTDWRAALAILQARRPNDWRGPVITVDEASVPGKPIEPVIPFATAPGTSTLQ